MTPCFLKNLISQVTSHVEKDGFLAHVCLRGLACLLIMLLLTPGIARAHGLCQRPALPEVVPAPDTSVITAELHAHHRYLFNEQQLVLLEQAQATFLQAGQMMGAAQDDAARQAAGAKHGEGSALLFQLMEGHPCFIDVDIIAPGNAKMDLDRVIVTPGDSAAVLFRIRNGEGPPTCSTSEWDIKRSFGGERESRVPYAPSGTTYALMEYRSIPPGRTAINVKFAQFDQAEVTALGLLAFEAPATGLLNLSFVDENGDPTPVMMRMVSKYNDEVRVPSGALDFSDQFEIGGAPPPGFYRADARPVGVNGPLFNKYFHCVPKSFLMGLPPGEYDIALYKGVEYGLVQETFTIVSGETTDLYIQMERWTNMARRGWYSGDDHVHASIMNDKDAEQMMTITKATDTNVSNILCMGSHRRIWFMQRGWGPDFRVQDGNYVLVPGQEGPRYFRGHAIGLNLKRMVRDHERYLYNEWAADTIHAEGGLYGQAHLAHGLFEVDRDLTLLVPRGKSDFGEILQFNTLGTDLYYQYLNLGFKLAAAAGSDTPYGGIVGEVRMYAKVGKRGFLGWSRKFDVDDWFDAVRDGHTFVTNGPMIDFHVDSAGPGDEIVIDSKQTLTVRARTWGQAGGSAPSKLMIIEHGETVKEIVSTDLMQDVLELELDLKVEYGTWIAVRVMSHDGSQAHTTPVYVTREGYRFWDVDKTPDLIAKRYATLDSFEQALMDNKQAFEAGTMAPLNHFGKALAQQAGEVLLAIEETRAIYKDLETLCEQEKQQRTK